MATLYDKLLGLVVGTGEMNDWLMYCRIMLIPSRSHGQASTASHRETVREVHCAKEVIELT